MPDATCSYCLNKNKHFEVSGMRKFEGEQFTKYQLCRPCNSLIVNLNPRVDSDKRREIWLTIWKNVQSMTVN